LNPEIFTVSLNLLMRIAPMVDTFEIGHGSLAAVSYQIM
jgi:hypothetical protein